MNLLKSEEQNPDYLAKPQRQVPGIGVFVAIIACLIACSLVATLYGSAARVDHPDLEASTRRQIACSSEQDKPQQVEVYRGRRWDGSAVVVYYAVCPSPYDGEPPWHRVGYNMQFGGPFAGLRVAGGGYTGSSKPRREGPIEYASKGRWTSRPALVYGRVLAPEVEAIEALFDNGEVLRDPADDGALALVSLDARGACELRVVGADGAVIRRIVTVHGPISYREPGGVPKACPAPEATIDEGVR